MYRHHSPPPHTTTTTPTPTPPYQMAVPNDTPARFSLSLYHCERHQSLRECVAAASWWLLAAGGFVVVWLFGCRELFLAVWASVWGVVWLAGLCSLVRIQALYEARGFWCIAAPPLPSWSQVKADNPATTNFVQYVLLMFFQTKPTPHTHHRAQPPCARGSRPLLPTAYKGPRGLVLACAFYWHGAGLCLINYQ